MKSPYTQRPDDQAREATEKFIERHARTRAAGRAAARRREQARSAVAAAADADLATPRAPAAGARGGAYACAL